MVLIASCCTVSGKDSNFLLKIGIGTSAGIIGLLLTSCFIILCTKRTSSSFQSKLAFKNDKDVEAFISNYGHIASKRYSFSEVKKMTNLFKDNLGEGGYGCVYKGKLQDGRLVAVKVLKESKGNGEDFINEVASISRTSHVNIVTLSGFCLEGRKRVLIYEFMSNGSLEKFIGNENSSRANPRLGWERLHQIAIGVAQGLEYLHRGCNTRIVHFDIKPNNILLDEDFRPKIADFGLAKLCTKKESIFSILETRGTIGYIAPEVFSRNFGGVSHRSDVYSYGMMILEMLGARNNDSAERDHTTSSEKYFPDWVYKNLERDSKFELQGVISQEDVEIVRKMTIVGLWCVQTNPSDRPSMSKVIEMLNRSIEDLKIPPKPSFFSPPRSPPSDSFTTSTVMA